MSTYITDAGRGRSSWSEAERVVLTGFMGSGKSTIGPLLAEKLDWNFVDLDREIEHRTGRTVAQIFADRGEGAFRAEETDALQAALHMEKVVIAPGGGAPETPANRALLAGTQKTVVVYLAATFATLQERCAQQAATERMAQQAAAPAVRPLFTDAVAAEARFAARAPLYATLAHLTIETDGRTPEEITAAVFSAIAPSAAKA